MEYKTICPICRAILPEGSIFCPNCGSRISSRDESDHFTVPLPSSPDHFTVPLPSTPDTVYLKRGTLLQGKYRINHVIGQGGFGITYDGTDMKLDMHVAVKEYFPRPIADRNNEDSEAVTCSASTHSMYEQGLRNFLREAKNMAKFVGEANFVSVHDYFTENNTAYIIMEFVKGEDLKHYLKRRGRLSMEESMQIIMPVMDALEKIHDRGMVHRDISPSNIMILPDGRVKLLDFGAVRDISFETRQLTTMSAVFKHGYSPIEQQAEDMRQGTFSDIYALCATLYEMLTGYVPPSPFARLSGSEKLIPPSAMGVRITPSQEEGILKGLEIYGKDRIQTVRELRDALLVRSVVQSSPGHDLRGIHRDGLVRALLVILGAAAAILLILLGFTLVRSLDKGNSKIKKTDESAVLLAEEESREDSPLTDADNSAVKKNSSSEENASSLTADGSVGEKSQDYAASSRDTASESAYDDPNAEKSGSNTEDGNNTGEENTTREEITEEKAAYDYPEGTLSYGGHHYYIYDDVETSWEKAMANCHERGGYLAVINDAEENEALYNYMLDKNYKTACFGLYYNNGNWEYLSGDTSDYRDWGVNSQGVQEPNNANGEEIHAALDAYMHDGHWNDVRFGRTDAYTADGHKYRELHMYICEWGE